MDRAREEIRRRLGQRRLRQHVAPRADRRQRRVLPRIALRRQRHRLQRGILLQDGGDVGGARRDEARTRLGERVECRPAHARAPERFGAAVGEHRRAVGRFLEVNRLDLDAERIEHRAAERRDAGRLRAEHHGLAPQIRDRAVGTVGAHDQQARRRVHRRDDAQLRVGLGERRGGDLARDEREVELVGFEQRHVLGAALGVARLDAQLRLLRVDHRGEGVAVNRETAARRGGSEDQRENQIHYCCGMCACCTIFL